MVDPASILKVFAEETRLRILRLISSHELCVSELVEATGLPQSSISRHLGALKQAGLVRDRREGTWVYYAMVRVFGGLFVPKKHPMRTELKFTDSGGGHA